MVRSEGPSQSPFIERLRANTRFRELAEAVRPGQFPAVRDAELIVRKDGVVFNVEGWHHPSGLVVAEAMYLPDQDGPKNIFGQQYTKATLYPGSYTPVPYRDRGARLREFDPSLDQTGQNPYYAKYKQLIPRDDIVAHLPAQGVYRKLMENPDVDTSHFEADIADAQRLLGVDFDAYDIGLTGAPLLGNIGNVHDVDVVFSGDLAANLALAKRMRDFSRENPNQRVIEGGKGWNIRYYNERGSLMCNFFTYGTPEDAPLREFEMDVIAPDVSVRGTVYEDTHSMYTPTVLGLTDVQIEKVGDRSVNERAPEDIKLIAYHTATRGECFSEDVVTAQGALVNVRTPEEEYRAICVIEREGVRNLTPTWPGFYEE